MFTSTAGSSPWTQGEWEGKAGVFVQEKAIAEGGGTFSGQGQLNLGRSFLGRAYTEISRKRRLTDENEKISTKNSNSFRRRRPKDHKFSTLEAVKGGEGLLQRTDSIKKPIRKPISYQAAEKAQHDAKQALR
ncbi:hypothetical protein TNIN_492011 [Trichonephila inaurata madagascariensis]|uniref:Uncharacterized protein n=1 Tax=Trichonephila inaurata madagascariensis TaxID=2747483 RepID=A0A8X7CMQ2_9ARAC|nr:hypothetical protein TNIN_492011 [Trichonephila inaurata madagascariensis]